MIRPEGYLHNKKIMKDWLCAVSAAFIIPGKT